ncbi:hypothetical protein M409DRAFT_24590 [Zasmidium cellare ATCC 36951]|uniref:ARS-binding protein 2 n=1 Tax=Zasmidium cellare ATCC 36951 TaxID=1080233 RepID=A0A6A6CDB7_ZASCE|nr:uncharacterized protein M409DRAFT_24590 [Zasmidium cellare ATCC 36951]KAF2165207.1 hypothetical protein M409DRAFT_24590 [Zasmidium cellare ATCC 36951]
MAYRQQQNQNVGHHQIPGNPRTTAFAHSQFNSPVYGIDPGLQLQSSPQGLQPQSARQGRHSSNERGSMQPPNISSPRMNSTSPGPAFSFKPIDRALPSRDVTPETIADAYVNFILYANPNFALDVDTSTLKQTFETGLPKSDNKDFEPYRLFELLKKFDSKEIKTWNQLALDLGVEPPDPSKGQSVQKVQQYSVRLKRWMRAMHIDAFFDHLMGKQHAYFTEIPNPNDPYPTSGRDGVTAEEDLAIRALDPSFRPKRGRRRNSETEQDDKNDNDSATKSQSTADSAAPYSAAPMSAVPMSAHPDSYQDPWAVASAVTPQSFAPWSARTQPSAVPASATSNLRWQLGHSQTPGTPHPMSAVPPSMSAHIDAAFDGEPKSAVTPSRKRRRHGPAVSSAWPSNSAPGAKPRGRPPANRNTQDGPFSTFPADPTNAKSKSQANSTAPTPPDKNIIEQPSPQASTPLSQPGEGRPGRLSLQVPPHTGGPVRLATPPTLLVNGETNESETRSDSDDPSRVAALQAQLNADRTIEDRPPNFSFENLRRVVASDLLRADIRGRRQRLTGDEGKRLADSILDRLNVPRTDAGNPREDLARLTAASWLGVGDQFNVPLGPTAGHGKRINVTRFRTDADGYEEITYDESVEDCREVFDIYWHVSQGSCMGTFELKNLSLSSGPLSTSTSTTFPSSSSDNPGESTHDLVVRKTLEAMKNITKQGWLEEALAEIYKSSVKDFHGGAGMVEENVDWKARCRAMEFASMVAKGEVERSRQRFLEKVMDALL